MKGAKVRVRAKRHFGGIQQCGQFWEKLWKDVFSGRTLVVSAGHKALGAIREAGGQVISPGVFSVPLNAVQRFFANREIARNIRVVTDLRGPNCTGGTRNRPPALAPWHRDVARSIIWWSIRLLGLPIFLVKQDVGSAFKIGSWLDAPDMGRHATDLPNHQRVVFQKI